MLRWSKRTGAPVVCDAAVRAMLIDEGVSPDQITTAGRGEAEPAVPTADGVREQANRRAEIIIQQ